MSYYAALTALVDQLNNDADLAEYGVDQFGTACNAEIGYKEETSEIDFPFIKVVCTGETYQKVRMNHTSRPTSNVSIMFGIEGAHDAEVEELIADFGEKIRLAVEADLTLGLTQTNLDVISLEPVYETAGSMTPIHTLNLTITRGC